MSSLSVFNIHCWIHKAVKLCMRSHNVQGKLQDGALWFFILHLAAVVSFLC